MENLRASSIIRFIRNETINSMTTTLTEEKGRTEVHICTNFRPTLFLLGILVCRGVFILILFYLWPWLGFVIIFPFPCLWILQFPTCCLSYLPRLWISELPLIWIMLVQRTEETFLLSVTPSIILYVPPIVPSLELAMAVTTAWKSKRSETNRHTHTERKIQFVGQTIHSW